MNISTFLSSSNDMNSQSMNSNNLKIHFQHDNFWDKYFVAISGKYPGFQNERPI